MKITNNSIRRFLAFPETLDEFEIYQVDAASSDQYHTLMFINKEGYNLAELDSGMYNVFIIDESYPEFTSCKNEFIRVHNPKYRFCLLLNHFNLLSSLQRKSKKDDSSPSLYYNTFCREIKIGANCIIDPGVIIGGTDFSPVLGDIPGEYVQFPQMGGVWIGDNVVIKYNTMIGKGTFCYTTIGHNTMIDFGCQIGHNCIIGDSCIIAAGTIIGGSTSIGAGTIIGMGAKIRNGLIIGKGAKIGMGAIVINNVAPGATVVGNPAHEIEHGPMFTEKGLL